MSAAKDIPPKDIPAKGVAVAKPVVKVVKSKAPAQPK